MLSGMWVHACATKCEKCEKEGKAYILRGKSFDNVSAVSNCTECEDMVNSQDDHTYRHICKYLLQM